MEMLELFRWLRNERGISIVFISHDLLALSALCDRVAVLRSGELVEVIEGSRLLTDSTHDYTRQLAEALRGLIEYPVCKDGNSLPARRR